MDDVAWTSQGSLEERHFCVRFFSISYFGDGPFGGFAKLGISNCTAVD